MRHIVSILIAAFGVGYRGKTVNIVLHSIKNGVVLLTYHVSVFGKENAMRAFISTDSGL